MAHTFLDDRRRGAEEAFFAKQNELLRVQLRATDHAGATPPELAAASGIQDNAVLETLVGLKVGTEGAAALSLIPLVVVAWADGEVSAAEREALLSAAMEAGLDRTAPGYKLFAGWLDDQPPAALLARWKDFVGALLADMDRDAKQALRGEILDKARAVASAAGGFLGLGRISAAEESVLRDLDRTLKV